jgi:hypothetical protein
VIPTSLKAAEQGDDNRQLENARIREGKSLLIPVSAPEEKQPQKSLYGIINQSRKNKKG